MIATLKRRAGFSAAHSYSIANLGEQSNRDLFGAYAGGEGHGHNWRIEIAISGPIDERTGMVVNIAQVDRVLKEQVVSVLDGRFLNREVDAFRTLAPTTENLVRFAVQSAGPHIKPLGRLDAVTIWESERLWAQWNRAGSEFGESGADMITLTRAYDFSASHRLHSAHLSDEQNRELFGKCNNPNGHGHNYEIEVSVCGTPAQPSGMVFDLAELDSIVDDEVLAPLDHKHLNLDIAEFANVNPTSEMLAVVIWKRLARRLPTAGDPRLCRILVRETARNSFEYNGETDVSQL